jgi:hypothetical protein
VQKVNCGKRMHILEILNKKLKVGIFFHLIEFLVLVMENGEKEAILLNTTCWNLIK